MVEFALRDAASGQDAGDPSEKELIDAIERGDPRAATPFYDALAHTIDLTIFRVMGRRETDHDDLVQSAFEQLLLSITRRRFSRACSLRSWAHAIASHVALNALRAKRRERSVLAQGASFAFALEQASAPQDLERQVASRLALEQVRESLAQMDANKALAVVLHDGLGYDLAEVAVLTACSPSAAQTQLVRGRRELLERARESSARETDLDGEANES